MTDFAPRCPKCGEPMVLHFGEDDNHLNWWECFRHVPECLVPAFTAKDIAKQEAQNARTYYKYYNGRRIL